MSVGLLDWLYGRCVGSSAALHLHRWVAFLPGLFLLLLGCRFSMYVVVFVDDVPVVVSPLLVSGLPSMAEVGVVLLSDSFCLLRGRCCCYSVSDRCGLLLVQGYCSRTLVQTRCGCAMGSLVRCSRSVLVLLHV